MKELNNLEGLLNGLKANGSVLVKSDAAISFLNFCRRKDIVTKAIKLSVNEVIFELI